MAVIHIYKPRCLVLVLAVFLMLFCCSIHQVLGGVAGEEHFLETKAAQKLQMKRQDQWMDFLSKGEITTHTYTSSTGNDFTLFKFEGENVREMKIKEIFQVLQNWLVVEKETKHKLFEMDIGGRAFLFRLKKQVVSGQDRGVILLTEGGRALTYEEYYKMVNSAGLDQSDMAKKMLKASREPMNAQTPWPEEYETKKVRLPSLEFTLGNVLREMMVLTQVIESMRPTPDSFKKMEEVMDKATNFRSDKEKEYWDENIREYLDDKTNKLTKSDIDKIKKTLLPFEDPFTTIAREAIVGYETKTDFIKRLKFTTKDTDKTKLNKFKEDLFEAAKEAIKKSDPRGTWKAQKESESKAMQGLLEEIENKFFKKHHYAVDDEAVFRKFIGSELKLPARVKEDALIKRVKEMVEVVRDKERNVWRAEIEGFITKNSKSMTSFSVTKEELKEKLLEYHYPFLEAATNAVKYEEKREQFSSKLGTSFSNDVKLKLFNAAVQGMTDAWNDFTDDYTSQIDNYTPKNGRIPGADKAVRSIITLVAEGKYKTFEDAFKDLFELQETKGTHEGRRNLGNARTPARRYSVSESEFSGKRKASDEGSGRKAKALKTDSTSADTVKSRSVAVADRAKVENTLKESFKSSEFDILKGYKVVDKSVKWENDRLKFKLKKGTAAEVQHEVRLDPAQIKGENYIRNRVVDHMTTFETSTVVTVAEYYNKTFDWKKSDKLAIKESVTEGVGKAVGGYGAAVGIFTTVHYLEEGDYGQAAFSAFQAGYTIGGLTELNKELSKLTKNLLRKGANAALEKLGFEKTVEEFAKIGAEAIGETASKIVGRILGNIPFVGLAFDIYFITEDIKSLADENDKTPEFLKVAHLVLDVETAALSIVEAAAPELSPILEPIIIGLTIIRISIDSFYNDIKSELAKVKGKGFGEQVKAVLLGFAEGVTDTLTLGLYTQLNAINEQLKFERDLLRNLSNPENYFKVTYEGENGRNSGRLDFTAGEDSTYGGFLTVRLNEDGSFKVTVAESRGSSGGSTRTFPVVHPVNDIVLGVGQVQNPKYQTQKAKLWLLITVETEDVISGFENYTTSRYGTYYGNSNNNSFYALQGNHLVTHDAITEYLKGYHYDIYGEGGNDRFYLGPQTSRVTGGEGSDMYIVPEDGGRVIINNFAFDERMDILHINIPHDQIKCARHGWHLAITHGQENNIHTVFIENWFAHDKAEFYRHMFLHSRDGVMIDVTSSGIDPTKKNYQVECKAVSIDLSAEKTAQTVELYLYHSLSEVKQVTGSNYDDDIIGSDKPNAFNGGPGEDYIKGGDGADVYFIDRNEGPDLIENIAADKEEDTIIIGVPYNEIMLQVSQPNLDMIDTANQETLLTLNRWFSGANFQHAAFLSSDQIRFIVDVGSDGQTPLKKPLSIDLSTYEFGVRLDLENPGISNVHTSLRHSISERIQVVVDSPYDDDLKGNALDNILTCTKGSDQLQGNGGQDTYLIEGDCGSVTIRNFHTDGEMDLILLSCMYSTVQLSINQGDSHLNIDCRTLANKPISITLVDWFVSEDHRHLTFKTKDKRVAVAPEALTDPLIFYLVQMEFDIQHEIGESCPESLHLHYHLDTVEYSKCERFIVEKEKCSFSITGNSISNYLDPGPGNHYNTQVLKGNNGSDTYVMGHNYGQFNSIDNYAKDDELDHLKFDVVFHDTEILKDADNLVIRSRSMKDSVSVTVLKFCSGPDYQHLLVHSIDGILYLLDCRYPYFKIFIVDFSSSVFSQVITANSASDSVYSYDSAAIILGSRKAQNHIKGSKNTKRLVGGQSDDIIIGGSGDEELLGKNGNDQLYGEIGNDALYGAEGDDYLEGGEGHDVLFGGLGADLIVGGSGVNTIVFSGYDNMGVTVNLYSGQGIGADAEGDVYKNIRNIFGSEYDDFLVGNDDDNFIRGFAGDDYIIPEGAHDILEGGMGSDIYDLTDAHGFKTINNFDPNEKLDLILMNKTTSQSICYYFYGKDLQINVNYDDLDSSTDAVRRMYLDEDFMVITIAEVLTNITFQHFALRFSDKFLFSTDFVENGRQMEPLINIIRNGTTILSAEIDHVYSDHILVTYNHEPFNDIVIPASTNVELFQVHVSRNSTEYAPLRLPLVGSWHFALSSLTPGSQHSIFLILRSCRLTLALSEPVTLVTPPLPPIDLIVEPFFDGFKMSWTNPNSPSLLDISYKVVIWSEEVTNSEPVTKFTNENTFSIFSLIPNTEYHITVTTVSFDTESTTSVEVVKRTSSHTCTNLQNLPESLFITDIESNSQSQLVAELECRIAYILEGSNIIICNAAQSLPQCILKTCPIEIVSMSHISTGQSGFARHGELVTWQCNPGYGVDGSKDETFSSTCLDGDWFPDICTCADILKCPQLPPPSNGAISSTEPVFVGENVTYSCPEGYELSGPTVRSCIMNSNKRAYWAPNEEVTCIFFACPSLIHQTDGRYIDTTNFKPISNSEDTKYMHGDSVILECHYGYFPGPDHMTGTDQYNRITITCNGHQWIPEQRECQQLVTIQTKVHYLEYSDVTVSYGYSGSDRRESQESLMEEACIQAAGTVNYEVKSTDYTTLKCIRISGYSFQHNPNDYSGLPTIAMEEGNLQGLCIGDSAPVEVAEMFCELAGFRYTSSVYTDDIPVQTSYRISTDYRLEKITESCNKRISCKKSCDTLTVNGGTAHCPSHRPLAEGDVCEFSCDVGSAMTGSYQRECMKNGWTGEPTNCNAEMWKTNVEDIVRRHGTGRSHSDLAHEIRDRLSSMYHGMKFVVIVYDELYGGDNHYYYSSYATDVTSLWRLNGHNVIVQRLSNNPNPPVKFFQVRFLSELENVGCSPFQTSSSSAKVCAKKIYDAWKTTFGPLFVHITESPAIVLTNFEDSGSRFAHFALPLIKKIGWINYDACCGSATLLLL